MSRSRTWCPGLAVVLALVLAACAPTAPTRVEPRPAPALSGVDLEGTHRDVAELEGSVVVVSVWASWCGPCRDEIPVLARAQERLGPAGLVVLGLNFRDNPDAAGQFLAEVRPPFPSVADPKGTIAVGWGVSSLPQSFLLDRHGQVVAQRSGPVTDAWVDDVVVPEVRS